MSTDDADHAEDVPEEIENIMMEATDKLWATGADDLTALHWHIGYGLAMLPCVVCHEHLLDELACVEEAIANLKARVVSGSN